MTQERLCFRCKGSGSIQKHGYSPSMKVTITTIPCDKCKRIAGKKTEDKSKEGSHD